MQIESYGPRRPKLALLTLCLAVLVAQIDTAVVNLAVRAIGKDLGAGIGALQWIVDGYNAAYAVLLLTGGLLADVYGRRKVFVFGTGVFTAASLLCAAAPSAAVLVLGRVLTGVGAAFLVPASLAIIRVSWVDPARRGRVLGVWAACNGLAMAIGPTLGGLLIRAYGWRSIFLVVVPLGAAACVLALACIAESRDAGRRAFDGMAQALGAAALGGLVYAAIQFHGAPRTAAAALAAAMLAFALFLRIERSRGAAALVPLDMFGSRVFRGAMAATAGMTFGMYGVLFLLPLVWQETGRLDALATGLALLPMALVFVVVSTATGTLARYCGARPMAAGGVAIIGAGLLTIGASAHHAAIVAAEIGLGLTGLGMGLATGPLMGAAVGAVAAARSGTASALINVARMMGATLGVAALGSVYSLAGGGQDGLRAAMLAGGAVQIACASIAWRELRP